MKNIAVITARSGSKGVKDKNIRDLCGKPLLAYSIECANESGQFDTIIVSTDSERYAQIARSYGAEVPFLRSEKNSGDRAGSWDTVREVITNLERRKECYDTVMLLQPTSPLRTAKDIENSFCLLKEKEANAIVSVCEAEHSPLWCGVLEEDGRMDRFYQEKVRMQNRQALPKYYRLNGAIYLLKREELDREEMFTNRCYAYVMPAERSVDIDTEFDFKVAECLLRS